MLKLIKNFWNSFFAKPNIEVQPNIEGSTICASCGEPIYPGMHVAAAWIGAPQAYTHATYKCDESFGATYVGVWGNGRLKGLKEVYDFHDTGTALVLKPKRR